MIGCRSLTKRYGALTAVDNLSFEVSPGEVLGFLGPNGAGKTTTMRIIAGFLAPSSGSVTVAGFDVVTQGTQAKQRIGYLPEGAPSYPEMTPRSFLEFVADIRGLKGAQRRERLDRAFGELHLDKVAEQQIETLSKGYKRRVGLAQAILHDPEVLILDEPTDGLDPNQKHEVRELINGMAKNKIIVISTHILEEVDAVCNRAMIIAQGRILADDTPRNLETRSRYHNAVSIKFRNSADIAAARSDIERLTEVSATNVDAVAQRLTAFPTSGQNPFTAISELARANSWQISELHLEAGRLDEVFRSITTGEGLAA
ncbi:MAG TPA: ABC transporter ATP-binding protein [Gammaproteobacteria bacterium]|nr:ABC transporter ATP-binding protein [Gammaproteobacteria bacterium]